MCLYFYDILFFGIDIYVINEVKSFLSQCFDMKDLCETNVILNIKLIKKDDGITLLESHYVERVLSHFGYKNIKHSLTLYDSSLILRKNKRLGRDQLRYSQLVHSCT